MKFGLLMENSVPRPWTQFAERDVFLNSIEQVKVAESVGFERVWAVEHHFLEEYSHSSCPEMFLTACAMVTSKIRLGFGIATCVPEMNHPTKIAERAAMLDLLSNGRFDVGTGRSSTWNELGGFGANIGNTKKSWDEFRNDPEWQKVQKESEANGKLVTKVDSVFAEPTDYSPMK